MITPTRAGVESLIRILASAYGLPVETVIRQCATESSFRPDAHNKSSDCYGLFQLAGPTARELGVDRRKWHENVFGGIKYLAQMYERFGTMASALAAYNWGPGNLRKCQQTYGADWDNHMPKETLDYLNKILGADWRAGK